MLQPQASTKDQSLSQVLPSSTIESVQCHRPFPYRTFPARPPAPSPPVEWIKHAALNANVLVSILICFWFLKEGRTRLCILIELIIRVATVLATSFKTTPCILTLRTTALQLLMAQEERNQEKNPLSKTKLVWMRARKKNLLELTWN